MPPPETEASEDYQAEISRLDNELVVLRKLIANLTAHMLTPKEVIYVRDSKIANDHATWAWQKIRTHMRIVSIIGTALGVAAWWILTHTITIGKPP